MENERDLADLAGAPLGEKFANFWNQIHGDFHRRVCGRFVGGFVFGDGFVVGLPLVMFEDAAHAFRVPPCREFWLFQVFSGKRRGKTGAAAGMDNGGRSRTPPVRHPIAVP
jgi:hypothetical protein